MELVTVTGRFELPDNSIPVNGQLSWVLVPTDIPDTSEPVVVLGGPVTVPLEADGSFTVDLRATDDPDLLANTSGPLYYRVSRWINGMKTNYGVSVPSPGPWDWSQLSPSTDTGTIVVPVPAPWTQMTKAAYDALPVKDPAVLYVIVG